MAEEKKQPDLNSKDINDIKEIKVDLARLYKEETFTDLNIASLRRLVPVKPDGSEDTGRTPIFIGSTHILTNAGPIPIQCPVEANNLREAFDNLPAAIKDALEKMKAKLQELKKKEESKIIVPPSGLEDIKAN